MTLSLPAFAGVAPSHWAFKHVEAVRAGDSRFLDTIMPISDVHLLTEPLDASGLCLVHLAAMLNKPDVLEWMLHKANQASDDAAHQVELAARRDAVVRGVRHEPSTKAELDNVDRARILSHERAYLSMIGCRDASGRSVLHYAAASRGAALPRLLAHNEDRFASARSKHTAGIALFPGDAYVDTSSGALLSGPAPTAGGGPALPVSLLSRARSDPVFIDARDGFQQTPLHYATAAGDVRAVRVLVEHGADLHAETADGATPLTLACTRAVRASLVPLHNAVEAACGAPVARGGVQTPVEGVVAALCGRNTVNCAPVALGTIQARPNTAAAAAASSPQSVTSASRVHDALALLVNSGEDINGRKGVHLRAPLHVAALNAALDVAKLLLQNGARVDIADVNGCTPLHLAAELGTPAHQRIVSLLVEAGAAVNPTNSARKTPLHLAASGGPHWSPSAQASAAAAAPPPALVPAPTDADASADGDGDGVETDIAAGGAGAAPNVDGGSGMVTLLVRLGANLEAQDHHCNTPLLSAAKRGNCLTVDTLLHLGAHLYAANIRGQTALHLAAFAHQLPVVRQLVRWDAEIGLLKHILDSSGRSAYDVAADPPTREAMHTLFETCASGRLDLVQVITRNGGAGPGSASTDPWAPPQLTELSRVLQRSLLHCVVTGAARAVSKWWVATQAAAASHPRTAAPGAIAPLRPPKQRVNASAVHVIAGIGLRFVPRSMPPAPGLPHPLRAQWGGHAGGDVEHGFPERPADGVTNLRVDPTAYVLTQAMQMQRPKQSAAGGGGGGGASAYADLAPGSSSGGASLAAARLQPGSDLVSPAPEKEAGRVLDWLVRAGAGVDAQDADGVTPLMLCARYGTLFLLRRLLAAGASTALEDRAGNRALHHAHAFGQALAARVLEEAAADSRDLAARNRAGHTPDDVAGQGAGVLPHDSVELTLLRVLPPPARSAGLVVSGV